MSWKNNIVVEIMKVVMSWLVCHDGDDVIRMM